MAQPIVVAGATAESGAAVGPGQSHGARSYSLMADGVNSVPDFTNPLGKCSETVGRVTALFLASAERYNDEQVALSTTSSSA
jgi:hypothetical protein